MKTNAKSIYKKTFVFFILVIVESILGCSDYFGVFFFRVFSEFLLIPLAILASMIFVEYFGLQDLINGYQAPEAVKDEETDMYYTVKKDRTPTFVDSDI